MQFAVFETYQRMMNNKLLQCASLICATSTVLGLNSFEQHLSNSGQKGLYSNLVLAQTSQEQIARQVYQKSSAAVVTVKTGQGHGSGFILSKDGLIITNAHVIKPPPTTQEELESYNPKDFPSVVTVIFPDGKKVSADVLGFGKNGLDLAILKIHNQKNLHTLTLAGAGSAKSRRSRFLLLVLLSMQTLKTLLPKETLLVLIPRLEKFNMMQSYKEVILEVHC